jgi:hypothetical protein
MQGKYLIKRVEEGEYGARECCVHIYVNGKNDIF